MDSAPSSINDSVVIRRPLLEVVGVVDTAVVATQAVTVAVVDTTPPTLHLPADITRDAIGPYGATVSYTATATDLVDVTDPVSYTTTQDACAAKRYTKDEAEKTAATLLSKLPGAWRATEHGFYG